MYLIITSYYSFLKKNLLLRDDAAAVGTAAGYSRSTLAGMGSKHTQNVLANRAEQVRDVVHVPELPPH